MTDKREKPLDVASVNPRYEGMTLGGMARLLTRPKSPAARATLDRLQGRARALKKVEPEEASSGSG